MSPSRRRKRRMRKGATRATQALIAVGGCSRAVDGISTSIWLRPRLNNRRVDTSSALPGVEHTKPGVPDAPTKDHEDDLLALLQMQSENQIATQSDQRRDEQQDGATTSTEEKMVFGIQRIGSYSADLPISPHNPNAQCLQAGDLSEEFNGIQSSEPTTLGYDQVKKARQEFKFFGSGQLMSAFHGGFCLRRVLCRTQHVYDLGPCEDMDTRVVFEVSVPVRNTNELKPVGRPLVALNQEPTCQSCGPFMMIQFCKHGQVRGKGHCVHAGSEKSRAGWTQLRSQWLPPPDPNPGVPLFDVVESITRPASADGIAPLSQPVCGSFVGDGPDAASFFYFMKAAQPASAVVTGSSYGTQSSVSLDMNVKYRPKQEKAFDMQVGLPGN
ncbi:unnamed protein product [Amoebophrya sp. A25]|nr:unnamed protein product [Amoebophrya sp. A25]|eukprot:GSA25T00025352001.1